MELKIRFYLISLILIILSLIIITYFSINTNLAPSKKLVFDPLSSPAQCWVQCDNPNTKDYFAGVEEIFDIDKREEIVLSTLDNLNFQELQLLGVYTSQTSGIQIVSSANIKRDIFLAWNTCENRIGPIACNWYYFYNYIEVNFGESKFGKYCDMCETNVNDRNILRAGLNHPELI